MEITFRDGGTRFRAVLGGGELAFGVLSSGSPTGGAHSESELLVTGAGLQTLAREVGVTTDTLATYLRGLDAAGWRRFWTVVRTHASERHTWFDTSF